MNAHRNLVATARERKIPLKNRDGTVVKDKHGDTVYGSRTETVRKGLCPDHDKKTEVFVGVNEFGWVFKCPGLSDEDVRETKARPTESHYFVNDPATERVAAS